MRRFLASILIFFLITAVVDIIFGVVCGYLNTHSKGGDTADHFHITDTQEAPVLIMGSSRAVHHYNPDIISDSLGREVYNCGLDGNGILFQYVRLLMIMERYTPEVIIYDAFPMYDMEAGDNVKYLRWLKRWYGREALDSLISDIAPMEHLKLKSSLYRYNGDFIQMLGDYLKPEQVSIRGYKPMDGVINYTPPAFDRTPCEWDPIKLKYFKKFLDLCRERNIKLTVVYSPYFRAASSEAYSKLTQLCMDYDIPVIDMFADTAYSQNMAYFDDASHLNSTGAEKFSGEIGHRISLLSPVDR